MKCVVFILGSLNAGVWRSVGGSWISLQATAFRRFEETLLVAGGEGLDPESIPQELIDCGKEWIERTFCDADVAVFCESSLWGTLPYWSRCFSEADVKEQTTVVCFHDPFLEYLALRSQENRGTLFRRCESYDLYLAKYAARACQVLESVWTPRICAVLRDDWQEYPDRELRRLENVCRLPADTGPLVDMLASQFLTYPNDMRTRDQAYLEETRNVLWSIAHLVGELNQDASGQSLKIRCGETLGYLSRFKPVTKNPSVADRRGFLKKSDVADHFYYFRRMST